jgi:hypothetical protein
VDRSPTVEGEDFNTSSRVGRLGSGITSQNKTRLAVLAGRALALVDVRAVCPIVVTTVAARKLIDVLRMICAGFPCIPDDHLCIPVREPDICRSLVWGMPRPHCVLR